MRWQVGSDLQDHVSFNPREHQRLWVSLTARVWIYLPILVEWMASKKDGKLGCEICGGNDGISDANTYFHVLKSLSVPKQELDRQVFLGCEGHSRQPMIEDAETQLQSPEKQCVQAPADELSLGPVDSKSILLRARVQQSALLVGHSIVSETVPPSTNSICSSCLECIHRLYRSFYQYWELQ